MHKIFLLIFFFFSMHISYANEAAAPLATPVENIAAEKKEVVPAASAAMPKKYLFKNIAVDEVADNSDLARKNALLIAGRKAFDQLIAQYFAGLDTAQFSDEQVSSIIASIEVNDEIITYQRYQALVDVEFHVEKAKFFINKWRRNI